jgi:hypothetical protein
LNKNSFYKYGFYIFGATIIGGLIYFAVQNTHPGASPEPTKINTVFPSTSSRSTQKAEEDNTPVPKETESPTLQIPTYPIGRTQTATISIQSGQQNTPDTSTSPTSAPTEVIATAVPTTKKPESTETNSSPVTVGVPGITMTQMGEKLTREQDFVCTQSSAANLSSLNCDYNNKMLTNRVIYNTQAYGRDPIRILFIYSTIIQDNLDQGAAIKNFNVIAALPFIDSPKLAEEARTWVTSQLPTIQNVTDERVTTIGGIYYRLYGTPKSWFFEMGDSTSMD